MRRRGGSKPENVGLGRVKGGTREGGIGGEEGGDSNKVISGGKNKGDVIHKSKVGDAEAW